MGHCRSGVSAPLSQGFMSLFLCPWHLLRGRDGRGRMLWSRCQQQRRAPGGHQLTATCRRSILIQTARSRACFQNPSPQSPGLLAGAPGEHQAHSRQVPVGQGHVLAASPTSPCLHQHLLAGAPWMCCLHNSISAYFGLGRLSPRVRAIPCANKPCCLQTAFALPPAFLYAFISGTQRCILTAAPKHAAILASSGRVHHGKETPCRAVVSLLAGEAYINP